MTIFRQSVFIPTVVSSAANIATFANAAAGKLTLNGSIVSSVTGQVSFINSGYASGLSFTSGANISAASFTIVGICNGLIITETIAGPNINTVYTNNLFHTIISISVNAVIANAFTIGSNYNIAVVLTDGNSKMGKSHSNYNYNILLNSITAGGQWAAGSAMIYGVASISPTLLQASTLVNANKPSNYFALPISGAAPVAISQLQLNNGFAVQSTYPFAAIIVYLSAGINTTPVFIEISQS